MPTSNSCTLPGTAIGRHQELTRPSLVVALTMSGQFHRRPEHGPHFCGCYRGGGGVVLPTKVHRQGMALPGQAHSSSEIAHSGNESLTAHKGTPGTHGPMRRHRWPALPSKDNHAHSVDTGEHVLHEWKEEVTKGRLN